MKRPDPAVFDKIILRALYFATQMIHQANNRPDVQKGDPKVGGHPAACASSAHILGALHLLVKQPEDYLAIKPHASPMDHAYSHLMQVFAHPDGRFFSVDESKKLMFRLRAFMNPYDPNHQPAFQSYHAVFDPDSFHFFPSGSVGIPPVVAAYMALAYRFAEQHGFEVPKNAHFWSLMGDAEFREGSLSECMPDVAERGLNNVTWIVDYNRQNLDGARIINEREFDGTDADRIERMAVANGWKAIQIRHGKKRLDFFQKPGGGYLQQALERISDFELQSLFLKKDAKLTRDRWVTLEPTLKSLLASVSDNDILALLFNLGGHDIEVLTEALESSRKSDKPTLLVIHTLKGWGLEVQAMPGNHSELASDEEIETLRKSCGIPEDDLFQLFAEGSPEGKFCNERSAILRKGILDHKNLKEKNLAKVRSQIETSGNFPKSFGINLKLTPWANTQWMWGQIAAKLVRIANAKSEELKNEDLPWKPAAQFLVTMAPDVGTSTNLNPGMDGKIFAPRTMEDYEAQYKVKDRRRPDLVPNEKESSRHLRFEIEESNCMSCVGAFGKVGDLIGIPLIPFMTVYDFFIKRAHDQFFYNLYWQSNFILVGTPCGVTLSPEGAQHSWKSDLQIPNGIIWEPAFSIELDWILADATRRQMTQDNLHREGVVIRAVTRGIEQKIMLECIKKQVRFQGMADADILESIRLDVLNGGYWLIHYDGYDAYAPGDNVVHLFVMGALAQEATQASHILLEQGIYANIVVVTSPDLLIGTLGRETGYSHLRQNLGVSGNLYLSPAGTKEISSHADFLAMRGSRIPIVAICDGEPGHLDNIGSLVGTLQDTLAVRKHSKSGRPIDVYQYHHMDPQSIAQAALAILEQAASEEILIKPTVLEEVQSA